MKNQQRQRMLCGIIVSKGLITQACLCALLFVVAACGSTGTTTTTQSQQQPPLKQNQNAGLKATYDPCTLLSKGEVSQALQEPVDVRPDFAAPLCAYHLSVTQNSTTPPPLGNELFVAVGTSNDAKSYFMSDKNGGVTVQDVAGVGDDAFTVPLNNGASIVVLDHAFVYSITMLGRNLPKSTVQTTLQKLALSIAHTMLTSSPSLAVTQPAACQLITTQDAMQTLQNKPVQWLFTANDAGVDSCDYVSTLGVQKRVQVVETNNPNLAKNVFAGTTNNLQNKQNIPGIGDSAYYDGFNTLWVLKKSTTFHVTVSGTNQTKPTLEHLARLVNAHI